MFNTMPIFDVKKYMGSWYEIVKTNNDFQQYCTFSKATYTINNNDNTITVYNECFDSNYNLISNITGKARAINLYEPSKLQVMFFDNLWSDYNIIYTDYENISIVISPNDDTYSLWVLSRTQKITINLLKNISIYLNNLGININECFYNTNSILYN